jgi:hypothetical protein
MHLSFFSTCIPVIFQTNNICNKTIESLRTKINCCNTDNCNDLEYLSIIYSSKHSANSSNRNIFEKTFYFFIFFTLLKSF